MAWMSGRRIASAAPTAVAGVHSSRASAQPSFARRIWAGGIAGALVLAVSLTLPGLFHGTRVGAATTVQVELDCDTAIAGIQANCDISVPASGTRPVAVILTNNTGASVTLGAFNFDIFNPSCGGTGATITPANVQSITGCTIAAGAAGIWPASNPLLTGTSTGFTNVVNAVDFATGCATGGDKGNVANGASGTSTSFLSCFNGPGGETVANGGSVILGTETFNVDEPAGPVSIILTLSNVGVSDDATVGLLACDPTAPPPADPTGIVSGLCSTTTLHFVVPATATFTNTPAPPTATPVTPTATITPTPSIPDTDGDGLNDPEEALLGTNPSLFDTDGDGLGDGAEVHTTLTDPLKTDTDGDGLSDGAEVNTSHTNPLVADSDGDGLSDGYEVNVSHSDPNNVDSDGDGVHDGAEVMTFHTNPNAADTDGDGLNDLQEVVIGTNPNSADTDGDGLTDGQEVLTYSTSPFLQDSDGDLLTDTTEVTTTLTNPNIADTDHDGLSDGYEVNVSTTSPNIADTDGDGVSDGAEVNTYHSNPHVADTDTDGMPDGFEVLNFCLNVLVNDATADPDLDFVGNVAELAQGTLPCNPDSDGDGFRDKTATSHAHNNANPGQDNCIVISNPTQLNTDGEFIDLPASFPFDDLTNPMSDPIGDPCDPNADNDGLSNDVELGLGPAGAFHAQCPSASANTDPLKNDTDGDGVIDAAECFFGNDPASAASVPPVSPAFDSDHDGLVDGYEFFIGTNPASADSDGDGILDGAEFKYYGSNALATDSDGDGCPDGKESASVNDDRKVNSTDLLIEAQHPAPSSSSPGYIRPLDINKDGKVNSTDLLIVAKQAGTCF